MAYTRVNWENLPSTNTPVNADNLNKMDKGIANAVEKTGDTLTGELLFENKNDFSAIRKTRTLNNEDYQVTVGVGANMSARMEFFKDKVLGSVEVRSDGIYNGVSGKKLVEKSDLLNLIYPVGSIYMSVNSTNPATLFGGTWVQLKDRFLLGAGSTYSNGTTGGEATHTLSVNEIPSHVHNIVTWNYYSQTPATGTKIAKTYDSADGQSTINATTVSTGGGKAHNNMPPYLVVYMWKRTA